MLQLTAPIEPPRISPGTFVRLRREALGLTLENVATMLDSTPCVSTQRRAEWLGAIENDVLPISLPTAYALHDVIGIDMRILSYWMAIAEGAKPSLVETLLACGAVNGTDPVFIGLDLASGPDRAA